LNKGPKGQPIRKSLAIWPLNYEKNSKFVPFASAACALFKHFMGGECGLKDRNVIR